MVEKQEWGCTFVVDVNVAARSGLREHVVQPLLRRPVLPAALRRMRALALQIAAVVLPDSPPHHLRMSTREQSQE